MKIFARPEIVGGNVDVDKQLMKLKPPSLNDLAELYQKVFKVSQEDLELEKLKKDGNIDILD